MHQIQQEDKGKENEINKPELHLLKDTDLSKKLKQTRQIKQIRLVKDLVWSLAVQTFKF